MWSVNYPDYYENEDGELIESSTIFEDGFMKDANDIEGLEDYLKSLNILQSGDELIHSYSRERIKDFDYRTFLNYVYPNTREVLRSHGILINENFSVSDGGVYFFHPEIMFQHEGNVSDKLDLNYYDYDMNWIGYISYDLQNQMMAIEFPDWRIDAEFEYESYRDGGSVEQGNLDMVKNQVVQVEHHAKELMQTLKSNPQVDAWVVAKMDRATSNLSDITHYLEGEQNSFADGGVTDSNTYEKVKVTIRDVDMGGDVVYKGEHFFRKDQLAKKTNEEIGKHILNKYFLDYGNTYKYSITRTGETKIKMARGSKLDEYETYHKTLASALDEAENFVNKRGYEFSEDKYFPDLTMGGVKYGQTIQTKRDLIEKGGKNRKNTLILVVYRMDSGTYELTMYFAKSNYADGGETDEGIDLFEDYKNIPPNVQKVLDKYQDAFMDGDYQGLEKAHKELGKIGYEFEYYLDGQAYDLRPIGTKGKLDDYKSGGTIEELEDKAKEKLSTTFQLPLEIAVYVPSTINVDTKISKKEFDKRVDEAETWLGRLWGGFSANDVEGGFVSGKGATQRKLIQEDVVKITCFCQSEGFDRRFDLMLKKLIYWAKEWKQESIGLEVEGDLFYIDVNTTFDNKGKK